MYRHIETKHTHNHHSKQTGVIAHSLNTWGAHVNWYGFPLKAAFAFPK